MVTPNPSQTSAILNWGAGTTPNGFTAYVSSDALGFSVLQTWDSNDGSTTSITKFSLSPSTQYWYKVSPKESNGTVTANCSVGTFTTTA